MRTERRPLGLVNESVVTSETEREYMGEEPNCRALRGGHVIMKWRSPMY